MARQFALQTPAASGYSPRPRRLHARLSDERLAKLVAREGEAPFVEIYERYHQALYRYCRSILRNESDAQDALQSAMAGAYAALRTREREVALRPWLFRIAHNESVSLMRRRRPEEVSADEQALSAPAGAPEPDRALEQRERLATLIADLATLSVRQRAALLMRELNGLSIQEIGLALCITEGAAKQALFESRAALREQDEGRSMECEEISRLLWLADKRQLRSRRVRSHLGACPACREVQATISTRRKSLRALAPPLPALLASSTLERVLAHAGGGSLAAATGAASGGGSAATVGGTGGVGGAATGGGASAAGASSGAAGLAAHLGGALALKVGAAVVILAAAAGAGAARITLSEHSPRRPHERGADRRSSPAVRPAPNPHSRSAAAGSPAGDSAQRILHIKPAEATKSSIGGAGATGSVSGGAPVSTSVGAAPGTSSSSPAPGGGAQGLALGRSKEDPAGHKPRVKHESATEKQHGHAAHVKHLHAKTKAERPRPNHGSGGTHGHSQKAPSVKQGGSTGKAKGRSVEHHHAGSDNSSKTQGQPPTEHGNPAASGGTGNGNGESASPGKDKGEGHGREEHGPRAQSENETVAEPSVESVESVSPETGKGSTGKAKGH